MTPPSVSITSLRHSWPGAEPVLDIPHFEMATGEKISVGPPFFNATSAVLIIDTPMSGSAARP